MKKGVALRKTVKNERFIIRTKIKTIKVCSLRTTVLDLDQAPIN